MELEAGPNQPPTAQQQPIPFHFTSLPSCIPQCSKYLQIKANNTFQLNKTRFTNGTVYISLCPIFCKLRWLPSPFLCPETPRTREPGGPSPLCPCLAPSKAIWGGPPPGVPSLAELMLLATRKVDVFTVAAQLWNFTPSPGKLAWLHR